ncbi:MAG: permease-like cell division protein FtsX [Clostridiales bacterium]|nr:permease-like cell division protein FtsX [Clostridiales bacterium]
MKLSTFKYHLGQGLRGMFKNGFMSLAAIATVAACSFILILSLCVGMNINYILQQFEETIGITVFLGPDVTEEMAMDIQDRIIAIDHVSEVVYKTAEDNLDDALSTWENSSILEGLREDNPLPASFEISLDGAAYQEEVVKQLETLQVSVEAELNGNLDADDYVERIYLDENGNQITRKQAEELGIVEPEGGDAVEGETQATTQATTQAATQAATQATTATQPATEVVTSGAQSDAEATPQQETAEAAAEATTAAATTQATTQATTEAATETTTAAEEETEAVTYSSEPSQALLDTLNSAVAATAGGNAQLEGSYYYSGGTTEDYGVAGVELYDASEYGGIEYEYKGIEKIRHATEEANILVRINTAVRIFSVIVIVILCVISVSIIMNTIRLTVVIRKNEINIMKYVGATDWFIRWPFIIEGMLIGLIGSVIPTVLCFLGYTECLHLVTEKIPVINNIAEFAGVFDVFVIVAPVTIVFGVLLGIIGSVSSMRKYLRV